MNTDLSYKIMKATYYLLEGVPVKDVMDQGEVEEAILMLADILHIAGIPLYSEEQQ